MIKKYFLGSIIYSIIGLILAAVVAAYYQFSYKFVGEMLFVTLILAILEVSLSFDNAVVNATVLQKMTEVWRKRFLTWGIVVAVFGMRLVFPLLIVAGVGHISPIEALKLAIFEPPHYAYIMQQSHLAISAYGGAFLLLVGLNFFYDEEKKHHWIRWLEELMKKWGHIESLEVAIAVLALLVVAIFLDNDTQKLTYITAGLAGIITFVFVHGIGHWLEFSRQDEKDLHRASLGMFLYLEVLDASFSFDGVIGAFAITQNLFIIMIGLSIGAMFVRSLTVMFVDKMVLNNFAYLEHGAFYAILVLAGIMLVNPLIEAPEWVTGISGAVIIGISFWSSLRRVKANPSLKK